MIFLNWIGLTLPLSNDSQLNTELYFFTNPVNGKIDFNIIPIKSVIKIYNTVGQTVFEEVLGEDFQIDVSNLNNGHYILEAVFESGKRSAKIEIKNN